MTKTCPTYRRPQPHPPHPAAATAANSKTNGAMGDMTPLMIDLCSGLGGASAAMRERGWRVVTVDNEATFSPDVVADVREWRWEGEKPGLSGAAFYDLYNDPREVQPKMLPGFPAKGMFNIMKVRHLLWKERYPDKGQNRDFPFKNVENARPETIAASKPRIPKDKVPFNPRQFIKNLPEWENVDRGWGAGE